MKKNIVWIALLFSMWSHAQVNWSFTAKKVSDKVYELHCSASINGGWHIYSQFTPDGGPVPTEFKFTSNPIISLEGNVKEVGKMDQHHEPLFGVDVKQFSNMVDFVQVVKLKAGVKTSCSGTVRYMACDNTQCLPPKEMPFSIGLK